MRLLTHLKKTDIVVPTLEKAFKNVHYLSLKSYVHGLSVSCYAFTNPLLLKLGEEMLTGPMSFMNQKPCKHGLESRYSWSKSVILSITT